MKSINVTIEGTKPLLQHKFGNEINKNDSPEVQAEGGLYKDDKGKIYQPSEPILKAMAQAGKQFKFKGKTTFASMIQTLVSIDSEYLYFKNQKWVVDSRPVVIQSGRQRNRIVRSRPKFMDWALSFRLEFDDRMMKKSQVKEILDYAGLRGGIGDYRPKFGTFIVTKFDG